jgi:hypothetical protein
MAGRDRIAAAFAGEPTDRVPIFDQTVFSNVASAALGRPLDVGGGELRYREVCAWLQGQATHTEFVEKMLQDVAWLCHQVGYDMVRMPWRETRQPSKRIDEHTFLFGDREDVWAVCVYSPQTGNWHEVDNYLRQDGADRLIEQIRRQVAEYQGAEPPPEAAFTEWDRLLRLAGPDLAAACGAGGIGFGMHEPAWLEALYLEPDLMRVWHDQHADRQVAWIEAFRHHGADVCLAGGDFCYNAGPAYSPDLFAKVVLPGLQRIVQACERLGMRYIFRTDGDTWKAADLLFKEAGCHGYGEIDYSANMRLKDLRRAYPALCLFGNIDCAGALVKGSPDDVRRAVDENLQETGGISHVLGSSNSVIYETPPANYLAMLDAAKTWATTA